MVGASTSKAGRSVIASKGRRCFAEALAVGMAKCASLDQTQTFIQKPYFV